MTHEQATELLELRLAHGFDASEVEQLGDGPPYDYGTRVRCSACQVVRINGIPCHETGCPNQTHECAECEALIPRGYRLCESCANPEPEVWPEDESDGERDVPEPEDLDNG